MAGLEKGGLHFRKGIRKGKRSMLACLTRRKCYNENSRNSIKVKFRIKVIK